MSFWMAFPSKKMVRISQSHQDKGSRLNLAFFMQKFSEPTGFRMLFNTSNKSCTSMPLHFIIHPGRLYPIAPAMDQHSTSSADLPAARPELLPYGYSSELSLSRLVVLFRDKIRLDHGATTLPPSGCVCAPSTTLHIEVL